MNSTPPAAAGAHQANNFDAIRITAALAVLVSHHYALTAQAEPSFLGLHTWGEWLSSFSLSSVAIW